MPLSAAIDQTAELANPGAHALDNRAQQLANGAVVTMPQVRQSQREYKRRKVIRESGAGATADEVTASRLRMVAVDMAAALEVYGGSLRGGSHYTGRLGRTDENVDANVHANVHGSSRSRKRPSLQHDYFAGGRTIEKYLSLPSNPEDGSWFNA